MSQFHHAFPEQKLTEGTFAAYRRTDLHQEAVRRELIDPSHPTPPKNDLIRILENNVKVPLGKQVQPPKAVPLNEAHLAPEDRTPEEVETDPFGGVDENDSDLSNEETYQYLAMESNVFKLRKLFAETFPDADAFPDKVKKAEVLAAAAELLGIKGA